MRGDQVSFMVNAHAVGIHFLLHLILFFFGWYNYTALPGWLMHSAMKQKIASSSPLLG